MDQEPLEVAAQTWDRIARQSPQERTRFWHSPALIRLINQRWARVTGCSSPIEFICRNSGRERFGTALAIGCGTAGDELLLLKQGVADRLILSDISEVQLNLARAGAEAQGLDLSRIDFRRQIDMDSLPSEKIDLIYWRQSLHHMLDTDKAIAWSLAALRGDGTMYCHDSCPPDRMQWSSEALDWVERFRAALPSRCLAGPHPNWQHPARPEPQSVEHWISLDPTECADSKNIMPSLTGHAPQSIIFFLGGLIYGHAMNDILANFDEESDLPLFELAMVIDELLSHLGHDYFFTSLTNVGG